MESSRLTCSYSSDLTAELAGEVQCTRPRNERRLTGDMDETCGDALSVSPQVHGTRGGLVVGFSQLVNCLLRNA